MKLANQSQDLNDKLNLPHVELAEVDYRDAIFRFDILLEDYLQGIARGELESSQAFNVKMQDLEKYDYSKTAVSPEKLKWMFNRFGFSGTKHQQI